MTSDFRLRVTNLKSFMEILFIVKHQISFRVTNLNFKNKRFLFELLTLSWKMENLLTQNLKIKKFISSYKFEKWKNESWFRIIVTRDFSVEMKY